MFDALRSHGLQHTRPPWPPPSPRSLFKFMPIKLVMLCFYTFYMFFSKLETSSFLRNSKFIDYSQSTPSPAQAAQECLQVRQFRGNTLSRGGWYRHALSDTKTPTLWTASSAQENFSTQREKIKDSLPDTGRSFQKLAVEDAFPFLCRNSATTILNILKMAQHRAWFLLEHELDRLCGASLLSPAGSALPTPAQESTEGEWG